MSFWWNTFRKSHSKVSHRFHLQVSKLYSVSCERSRIGSMLHLLHLLRIRIKSIILNHLILSSYFQNDFIRVICLIVQTGFVHPQQMPFILIDVFSHQLSPTLQMKRWLNINIQRGLTKFSTFGMFKNWSSRKRMKRTIILFWTLHIYWARSNLQLSSYNYSHQFLFPFTNKRSPDSSSLNLLWYYSKKCKSKWYICTLYLAENLDCIN